MPYPTNFDNAAYIRDTNAAKQRRTVDLAANQYAASLARQKRTLKLEGLGKVWQNQRNSFNTPYLRRGFFKSGLRQTGLNNLFTQQANERGAFNNEGQQEDFGFRQKGNAIESTYQTALRQLAERKQQAMYQQLQSLQAVQPFLQF